MLLLQQVLRVQSVFEPEFQIPEEVLQPVVVPACNKIEPVLEGIGKPEFADSCSKALWVEHTVPELVELPVQHPVLLQTDCVHQFLLRCSFEEVEVVLLACKGWENLEFASYYHFLSINK